MTPCYFHTARYGHITTREDFRIIVGSLSHTPSTGKRGPWSQVFMPRVNIAVQLRTRYARLTSQH